MYRYKRAKTIATYNFGEYQIYVCELIDLKQQVHKGLAVLPSDSIIEVPFILTQEKADKFILFLKSLENGIYPKKFKLSGGWYNYFSWLIFKFTKQTDDNIQGVIMLGGSMRHVTIKLKSIMGCSNAIQQLFYNA